MAARKKAKKATAPAKKTTAKKAPAKKTTAKKAPAKKATAKKAPAKKTTAKKAPAKKTTAKKAVKAAKPAAPAGKISVGSKPFTKSEFITTIVEQTGTNRKDVAQVLDVIGKIIECHLKKNGPEMFTLPGLIKMQIVNKPAKKARKGTNPFTGEEVMFKAKPASRKVKLRPLKQLKAMAE